MHPLPAALWSGVAALAAAASVAWFAISLRQLYRNATRVLTSLVIVQDILLSLFWAVSGLLLCLDVGGVFESTNAVQAFSGIVIGSAAPSAVFNVANTDSGAPAREMLIRIRRARRRIFVGGVATMFAAFGLTALVFLAA